MYIPVNGRALCQLGALEIIIEKSSLPSLSHFDSIEEPTNKEHKYVKT